MLTKEAVTALQSLGTLSKTALKKKLGCDLCKVLDEPEVKLAIAATKMKGADLSNLAIPPGILKLIQTLGPILLKLLLARLGIVLPT